MGEVREEKDADESAIHVDGRGGGRLPRLRYSGRTSQSGGRPSLAFFDRAALDSERPLLCGLAVCYRTMAAPHSNELVYFPRGVEQPPDVREPHCAAGIFISSV